MIGYRCLEKLFAFVNILESLRTLFFERVGTPVHANRARETQIAMATVASPQQPIIRVGYLHGSGSTSQTRKATFLSTYASSSPMTPKFEVIAETYDTRNLDSAVVWAADFLFRQSEAGKPIDVLVGSSFGGAVAVQLLQSGVWNGPTLLLAQAYVLYAGEERTEREGLPKGVPITLIHGTKDSIVPIEGSRLLANVAKRRSDDSGLEGLCGKTEGLLKLIEVEDEHRLERLTTDLCSIYIDAIVDLAHLPLRHQPSRPRPESHSRNGFDDVEE